MLVLAIDEATDSDSAEKVSVSKVEVEEATGDNGACDTLDNGAEDGDDGGDTAPAGTAIFAGGDTNVVVVDSAVAGVVDEDGDGAGAGGGSNGASVVAGVGGGLQESEVAASTVEAASTASVVRNT